MKPKQQTSKHLFFLFVLLSLILLPTLYVWQTSPPNLQPFTTDGCSIFPDGDLADPTRWQDCCVAHDYSYWQGGTAMQKDIADLTLEECVADKSSVKLGMAAELVVSFGGSAYLPTWFRWGYGWPYPRGYKELTKQEVEEISEMSKQEPIINY